VELAAHRVLEAQIDGPAPPVKRGGSRAEAERDVHAAVVVEVQRHDLEQVPRTVWPEVQASNRGLGVDLVAEQGMSDRVPDVAIRNPVPSGTGVDANLTHPNNVLR